MARILLVEPDSASAERLQGILRARSWDVLHLQSPAAVTQTVAQHEVHAVLVGSGVPSAVEIFRAAAADLPSGVGFLRLGEAARTDELTTIARLEVLTADSSDEELTAAVERALQDRRAASPRIAVDREVSTSDLFAGLLDDVDEKVAPPPVPAAPAAAPASATSDPGARAATAGQAAGGDELDRVLEEALSKTHPGRIRSLRSESGTSGDVDELLRSVLGPVSRTRATPRTAAPAGSSAPAEAAPTPSTPAGPAVTEPAGTTFGSYELLSRIAQGGMAEVWRARMHGVEGFERIVAIKKILPHLSDNEDFSRMFVDEAKLAAQLNHEHIIHIYDFGALDGQYYLAMEYVEGQDLRAILAAARRLRRPLPQSLALLVASHLAAALDYAHRRKGPDGRELGLVHRDVSPQNVLIGNEGEVKLCDFGIALAVSKATKTQMGALKGKLPYMSPEQARGETVDARSDLFSLGAVLYEMLTAQRLFDGDSEMAILEAVREGRVQGPRAVAPALLPAVDDIVLRTLARDPSRRYESAGALRDALSQVQASLQPVPTGGELADFVRTLLADAEAARQAAVAGDASAAAEPAAAPAAPGEVVAGPGVGAGDAQDGGEPDGLASILSFGRERPDVSAATRKPVLIGLAAGLLAVLALIGIWTLGRGGDEAASPAAGTRVAQRGTTEPAAPEAGTQEAAAGTPETVAGEVVPGEAVPDAVEGGTEGAATVAAVEPTAAAGEVVDDAAPPTPAEAAPAPTRPSNDPEPPASEAAAAGNDEGAESALTAGLDTRVEEEVARRQEEMQRRFRQRQAALLAEIEALESGVSSPAAAGSFVNPRLVAPLAPRWPASQATAPAGSQVEIAVLVDVSGAVEEARLLAGSGADAAIDAAALEAARGARFRPGERDGEASEMWYKLIVPVRP